MKSRLYPRTAQNRGIFFTCTPSKAERGVNPPRSLRIGTSTLYKIEVHVFIPFEFCVKKGRGSSGALYFDLRQWVLLSFFKQIILTLSQSMISTLTSPSWSAIAWTQLHDRLNWGIRFFDTSPPSLAAVLKLAHISYNRDTSSWCRLSDRILFLLYICGALGLSSTHK